VVGAVQAGGLMSTREARAMRSVAAKLLLGLFMLAGCSGPSRSAGGRDASSEAQAVDGGSTGQDATDGSAQPPDGSADAPMACTGTRGAFHDQSIVVGGEPRYYFLYVPSTYDCHKAWPLVVDFHGTAFTAPVPPEELWNLDDAVAVAEAEGYILLRPRSRSAPSDGTTYYQWDINPGDLSRNVAFTRQLVDSIAEQYTVEPTRRYALGFSNGTNMAAQFLGTGASQLFSGVGTIMGGLWSDPGMPTFGADAPRIYAVDGYRDYLYDAWITLRDTLASHQYPGAQLFYRETNAGHEQYRWHFRESFEWLDKGARPPAGTLLAPWKRDTSFVSDESLVKVVVNTKGDLVVAGGSGSFFRRAVGGAVWSTTAHVEPVGSTAFAGMCLLATGRGFAVSDDGTVAATNDDGLSWALAPAVPSVNSGNASLAGVACGSSSTIVGVGYFDSVLSGDAATTWSSIAGAFIGAIAVAIGPSGSAVAGGGATAGRWAGGNFQALTLPIAPPFWNGVAATAGGSYWMVGSAGAIVHSADDGVTWSDQSVTGGEDLYAVAFVDANTGLAVGVHGYVLTTHNAGQTWSALATGLDAFLGDVAFADASHAVVVGEKGLVLGVTP
jgi:photosystem II stability/assembly factor-like uncharacterized protein/predicted esterase